MGATTLPVLLVTYRAGNKRPRGRVVERLKWLGFMSWRRGESIDKLVRRYPQYIGAACLDKVEPGNTLCRVMKTWVLDEDIQLVREVLALVPIVDIATRHGRTTGAITCRLSHYGLVGYDQQAGEYRVSTSCQVSTYRISQAHEHGIEAMSVCGFERRDEQMIVPDIISGKLIPWRNGDQHVNDTTKGKAGYQAT